MKNNKNVCANHFIKDTYDGSDALTSFSKN